ncbi:MAG: hypothetical protein ACUVQ1_06475 [Candidatus Kapaibacteriales bacterium]
MLYKSFFTFWISFLFALASCTPIQIRYNIRLDKVEENEIIPLFVDSTESRNQNIIVPTKSLIASQDNGSNNIDTTIIELTKSEDTNLFNNDFQMANHLFEKCEYQSAILLYRKAVNGLSKDDNRYWLSRIRISECLEKLGNVKESIVNLEETFSLMRDNANPFRSKIILMLANSYCSIGKKNIYHYYRRLLEEEYPNELVNLSSCN